MRVLLVVSPAIVRDSGFGGGNDMAGRGLGVASARVTSVVARRRPLWLGQRYPKAAARSG
jgi:hypothetical protein